MRDEYRRPEYAGLHQIDARCEGRRGEDQSAAAPARRQGPGAGPHQLLCPICLDRALAEDRYAYTAKGMAAKPRRSRKAGRAVRMHPVRLLLDLVPKLLVEQRALPGSGRTAAGHAL